MNPSKPFTHASDQPGGGHGIRGAGHDSARLRLHAPGSTTNKLDRLLLRAVAAGFLGFGAWTLAYQLVLVTRWPARITVLPFLMVLALLVAAWRGLGRRRATSAAAEEPAVEGLAQWPGKAVVASTVLLCTIAGLLALFLARPDLDDFSFFHRAVAQLDHLSEPFFLDDQSHDIPVPPLSTHHLLTAYEPLVALTASAIQIDPVLLYQNTAAFFAGVFMVVVFLLLFRQVGLGWPASLLATATALAFHLLDGGPHRSFGHFGLVRLWHGKAILATVLLPAQVLLTLRYLAAPSARRFLLMAMLAVSAVGLSSSAIFMVPILTVAVSLAHFAQKKAMGEKLRDAVGLNLSVFYCWALGGALVLGWLPRPVDTTIWVDAFPGHWLENLAMVLGKPLTMVRDFVLLVVVPLVLLPRPYRWIVPSISLALIALVANPIAGSVLIDLVQPGGFWRLAYLFPVTWCAGLLATALFANAGRPGASASGHRVRAAVAICTLAMVAISFPGTVFDSPTRWHGAWDYKFAPRPLKFARMALPHLAGRHLLAPPSLSILSMLDPTIKLEVGRDFQTLHAFRNLDREIDGKRRVRAQEVVNGEPVTDLRGRALAFSLRNGVDAVITLRGTRQKNVERRLDAHPSDWRIAVKNRDFLLYLRDQPEPPVVDAGSGRVVGSKGVSARRHQG